MEKAYPSVKLQVIFTTKASFSGFTKDVSPPHDKNNTVYRFRCHCDSEYVGKSTQRLHKRIREHVPNNLRQWINGSSKTPPEISEKRSAIGRHLTLNRVCADHYHESRFSILARGRNPFHLSVLESLYIVNTEPVLCKQKQLVYKTMLFRQLDSTCITNH